MIGVSDKLARVTDNGSCKIKKTDIFIACFLSRVRAVPIEIRVRKPILIRAADFLRSSQVACI